MLFIPFLLLFLAVFFAIVGSQRDVPLFKTLAGVLTIAAIGSCIVIFIVLSVN